MIVTLLLSTGSGWESTAFAALTQHPGIVVLKRCVDLDDLMAAASTGQAQVAVLDAELPGLDATVVADLVGHGVRVVAAAADPVTARPAAERIGIRQVRAVDPIEDLVEGVLEPVGGGSEPATLPRRSGRSEGDPASLLAVPESGASARVAPDLPPGRVVAVWGPGGAPGRTTIASALAAELARREMTTVLLDADPYGGCVAQQLGILDEVSGLLAAARLATAGTLEERLPTIQRRLSDRLWVVTGLPRPDRWAEVRPGTVEQIVEHARRGAQVVVDTGFSLEIDPAGEMGSRPERNGMTLEALEAADLVVLVGAADPVGLARLARAIAEARELLPDVAPRVVVNRMRPSLGWRERDVESMLAGFGATGPVTFLPDDQAGVDRALVAGRTLVESGESPLVRAVAGLLDTLAADPAHGSVRR